MLHKDSNRLLATVMKIAEQEYNDQLEEEIRLAHRRERNQRAIRQFLMFLLFLFIATTIIFRKDIARLVELVDGPDAEQVSEAKEPSTPYVKASQTIDFVNNQNDRRLSVLDEIEESEK